MFTAVETSENSMDFGFRNLQGFFEPQEVDESFGHHAEPRPKFLPDPFHHRKLGRTPSGVSVFRSFFFFLNKLQ